jgi:hypothetical protein
MSADAGGGDGICRGTASGRKNTGVAPAGRRWPDWHALDSDGGSILPDEAIKRPCRDGQQEQNGKASYPRRQFAGWLSSVFDQLINPPSSPILLKTAKKKAAEMAA